MSQDTPPKILLIVDDEDDVRESLRDAFQEEGYLVLSAVNGKEGLEQLSKRRPCAIILDLLMPVMTGTEMYEALQADPGLASIPVIVSTSDPSRAPSGALIMKKPIHLERLLDAVAGVCSAPPVSKRHASR